MTPEVIAELEALNKLANNGRGVHCVGDVITLLQAGNKDAAKAVFKNEMDKISEYPAIYLWMIMRFGVRSMHYVYERLAIRRIIKDSNYLQELSCCHLALRFLQENQFFSAIQAMKEETDKFRSPDLNVCLLGEYIRKTVSEVYYYYTVSLKGILHYLCDEDGRFTLEPMKYNQFPPAMVFMPESTAKDFMKTTNEELAKAGLDGLKMVQWKWW